MYSNYDPSSEAIGCVCVFVFVYLFPLLQNGCIKGYLYSNDRANDIEDKVQQG